MRLFVHVLLRNSPCAGRKYGCKNSPTCEQQHNAWRFQINFSVIVLIDGNNGMRIESSLQRPLGCESVRVREGGDQTSYQLILLLTPDPSANLLGKYSEPREIPPILATTFTILIFLSHFRHTSWANIHTEPKTAEGARRPDQPCCQRLRTKTRTHIRRR